jgi:hypothetical protein
MAHLPGRVLQALSGAALVACAGCSYAWDDYDPRLLPCSGMGLLSHDWKSGVTNDHWGPHPRGGVTIGNDGDEAVFSIEVPAAPDYHYSALQSHHRHNLRGDHISVEVPKVATNGAVNTALFLIQDEPIHRSLSISKLFANLQCELGDHKQSVAYDPQKHRFWRIREDGASTLCEASSDGKAWAAFGKLPTAELGLEPENLFVHLAVIEDPVAPQPDEVRFGPVNGGGAPTGQRCSQ